MVRYLMRSGEKIQLRGPPNSPEDSLNCVSCGAEFDNGTKRRASLKTCGHVQCLHCIFQTLVTNKKCQVCESLVAAAPEGRKLRPRKPKNNSELPPVINIPKIDPEQNDEDEDEMEEGEVRIDPQTKTKRVMQLGVMREMPIPSDVVVVKPTPPVKKPKSRRHRKSDKKADHPESYTWPGRGHYTCQLCGKVFPDAWNLRHHVYTHTGERPYQCSQCPRAFAKKSNLTYHQKLHNGDLCFKCTTCGKPFARRDHLEEHQRIHSGQKPIKCPTCGKGFRARASLWVHRKTCDQKRNGGLGKARKVVKK